MNEPRCPRCTGRIFTEVGSVYDLQQIDAFCLQCGWRRTIHAGTLGVSSRHLVESYSTKERSR